MMKIVRLYCIVGGMPAVVNEFIKTNDMAKVLNIQRGIVELYRNDV